MGRWFTAKKKEGKEGEKEGDKDAATKPLAKVDVSWRKWAESGLKKDEALDARKTPPAARKAASSGDAASDADDSEDEAVAIEEAERRVLRTKQRRLAEMGEVMKADETAALEALNRKALRRKARVEGRRWSVEVKKGHAAFTGLVDVGADGAAATEEAPSTAAAAALTATAQEDSAGEESSEEEEIPLF